MSDTPPRKKIELKPAVGVQALESVKRGVRKRGGAPAAYRPPAGSTRVETSAEKFESANATSSTRSAKTERPAKPSLRRVGGDAADTRPPKREWNDARPPRRRDDTTGMETRSPKREWSEKPPARRFERTDADTRPARGESGELRPARRRDDAGGAGTRPPKREWTERSSNRRTEGADSDTRPAKREWSESRPARRHDNAGGADTRPPKREWAERPPMRRTERSVSDARPPKREWTDKPPPRRNDAAKAASRKPQRELTELSTQGAHTFFATCPRGLETPLREELLAARVQGIEVTPGGASFVGSFRAGLEVNMESRIASRVLWKLASGTYSNEDDIYALAKAIDWPRAFPVDQTIKVQVTAIASPLTSVDFIALKVKDAICDAFRDAVGSRPNVDTSMPNQRIHIFLQRNSVTVYLDVSGEALFKRGYRRDGLTAPIRENLAAGILRLVKWSPQTPLLDPMCGSGTFITEALLIAMDAAPGLRRRNAHERWSMHPVDEFHAMKDAARARIKLPPSLKLFARDANEEAVRQTRAHVAALGGTPALDFAVNGVLALEKPCESGMLLANPPYGVRLGNRDELHQMYPQFASILREKFSGWTAHFITADLAMPSGLGLKESEAIKLKNGALDCRLFSFNQLTR